MEGQKAYAGPDGHTQIAPVFIGWLKNPSQFRAFLGTLQLNYGYTQARGLSGVTFWVRANASNWRLIYEYLEQLNGDGS